MIHHIVRRKETAIDDLMFLYCNFHIFMRKGLPLKGFKACYALSKRLLYQNLSVIGNFGCFNRLNRYQFNWSLLLAMFCYLFKSNHRRRLILHCYLFEFNLFLRLITLSYSCSWLLLLLMLSLLPLLILDASLKYFVKFLWFDYVYIITRKFSWIRWWLFIFIWWTSFWRLLLSRQSPKTRTLEEWFIVFFCLVFISCVMLLKDWI